MAKTHRGSCRRAFLKTTASVVGGLVTMGMSRTFARTKGSSIDMTGMVNPKGAIWSHEYWTQKGEIKLYMFRKRIGESRSSGPKLPVLFLAHGSSISSRPSNDLYVPGHA